MKLKRWIVLPFICLILAACGSNPDSGRVVAKRYEQAYTSYVQTCFAYSSSGSCTMWMPIPYTSGPFWVLTLKNGQDEWEELTDATHYESTAIGDSWMRISE